MTYLMRHWRSGSGRMLQNSKRTEVFRNVMHALIRKDLEAEVEDNPTIEGALVHSVCCRRNLLTGFSVVFINLH